MDVIWEGFTILSTIFGSQSVYYRQKMNFKDMWSKQAKNAMSHFWSIYAAIDDL